MRGSLTLQKAVPGMPVPPQSDVVGTEYVLSPPQFSLDDLISRKLQRIAGPFSNGSFDTPQRYVLTQGSLDIEELLCVHYLDAAAPARYANLPYLSYPRNTSGIVPASGSPIHLYFMHLLEQSPDFDQVIHVVLDSSACQFVGSDSLADVVAVGATFVVPHSNNTVTHRLVASPRIVKVALYTDANRKSQRKSTCTVLVLENIHCVTVPDSFAVCPPVV